MLGSNDLPKALAFYDELMPVIGAGRVMGGEKFQVYGIGAPALGICMPFDGNPATPGNGTMIALAAASQDAVAALHAKALELGGTDEGAPGYRGGAESGFYAAYFRDLDGNKLCAFKIG
jgi:catechol 2,3-dioxygenase-like lactoylglutathione lyase family enzyme